MGLQPTAAHQNPPGRASRRDPKLLASAAARCGPAPLKEADRGGVPTMHLQHFLSVKKKKKKRKSLESRLRFHFCEYIL